MLKFIKIVVNKFVDLTTSPSIIFMWNINYLCQLSFSAFMCFLLFFIILFVSKLAFFMTRVLISETVKPLNMRLLWGVGLWACLFTTELV